MEEREAAIFHNIRWSEWRELTYEDRVDNVAVFRLHRLIELHQGEAAAKEVERRQRQPDGG